MHFLRREDKEGHLEVSFITGIFLRISVDRLISFFIFNGVFLGGFVLEAMAEVLDPICDHKNSW